MKFMKKFSVYSFGPDGKDGKAAAMPDFPAGEDPSLSAGDILFAD